MAVLDEWWGASPGAAAPSGIAGLAHRLFFQHFSDTSYLVEGADGRLLGFLIGFLSQSKPGVAYIHLVGVDPDVRGAGLGAALYRRFFHEAARRGARTVRCVTTPGNRASLAFHRAMGFAVDPGGRLVDGVAVAADYADPGLDRVTMSYSLNENPPVFAG